jgi:hypothetical protein
MGWVYSEPFWLKCPDFADVLIGCQAFEGFEAAGVIVGVDEVAEMAAQLVVIVVVIAFDSRLFDRPVHTLNLAVGPGVGDLGQTVFDIVFMADTVKDVPPSGFVFLAVGELDAIVR